MAMRIDNIIRMWEALPLGGVRDIVGDAPALILAPHPDDESLGCGGLIAACCAAGNPPVVVVVTDGSGSHPGSLAYDPSRLVALRQAETRQATTRLGLPVERLHFLGLPDRYAPQQGPGFDQAVATVLDIARRTGCGTVLATWLHDPHCDHGAVHLMAQALTRQSAMVHHAYPVWGWMLPPETVLPDAPIRGWRVDIAAHLGTKRDAILAHASQTSDLIDDDATGFRLPRALLDVFERPYEVFLHAT